MRQSGHRGCFRVGLMMFDVDKDELSEIWMSLNWLHGPESASNSNTANYMQDIAKRQ